MVKLSIFRPLLIRGGTCVQSHSPETPILVAKTASTMPSTSSRSIRTQVRYPSPQSRLQPDKYGKMEVHGYTILSGNFVYKSSVISRELTPSRIQETWEKMRPENRYGQMTDGERVSFMLSDEGADYLFGFTIKADGKDYHVSLPGRVIKVLGDEQVQSVRANPEEKNNGALWTAFLLFAGYVDAATTFAQNCGGGGSAPDQNWGRDKNEDDILWARRCFRKAREMVTTPVIRRGMRR